MLHVDLDHILPEQDALQKMVEILDHVENAGETYVFTKNGRPVVAMVNVSNLEENEHPAPTTAAPVMPAPVVPEPVIAPAPLPVMPDMPELMNTVPLAPEPVMPTMSTPPATPAPVQAVDSVVPTSNGGLDISSGLPPLSTMNSSSPLSEPLDAPAPTPMPGTLPAMTSFAAPVSAPVATPEVASVAPAPMPVGLPQLPNMPQEDLNSSSPLG